MRIGIRLAVISAMCTLGVCAGAGLARADFNTAAQDWRNGKFTAAFNEFKSLAETGHPLAQFNLAEMYLHGNGPPQSFQMAYGWMSVAAAYGLGDAQARIKEWAGQATDIDRKRAQLLLEQFGPGAVARRLLPRPHCATSDPALRANVASFADLVLPDGRERVTAMILAFAYVAPDGYARDVRVLESFPRGDLQKPLLETLMKSRYEPATRDGAEVGAWSLVQYSFHPVGIGVMSREVRNHMRRIRENSAANDPAVLYMEAVTQKYWVTSRRARDSEVQALFEKAAEGGLAEAQLLLAQLMLPARCEGQEDLARYWLHQSAAGGSATAQIWLAHALMDERDPARMEGAIFWLRRAAASGQPAAMRLLSQALMTSPTPDLPSALSSAEQLSKEHAYDPSGPALRARVHALMGNFPQAQEAQSEAIARARELRWKTSALEAALADYRANRVPETPAVETGAAHDLIWPRPPESARRDQRAQVP